MKTKQITLFAFVLILLVAIFTNPSQDEHKEKVKKTFTAYYQKSLNKSELESENAFSALGNLLGTSLINSLVDNAVLRDNYLIFSVTKITYEGKEKSIGYGLFGNVFLSDKIEETFDKNINK